MTERASFAVKSRVLSQLRSEEKIGGLPFRGAFGALHMQEVFDRFHDPGSRVRLYCLPTTTQAMISQHIAEDSSLQAAVHRVNSERLAMNLVPTKGNTGSYSDARQRVPVEMLEELVTTTGRVMEENLPAQWLWKNKYHVKTVDGTCFKMADTPENQKCYPQPKTQKQGIGFPMMRAVAISSLTSGAILGLAYGPEHGTNTGEHALLRRISGAFKPGDVVLGDAYFPSYFRIAEDQSQQVNSVYRLYSNRKVDFSRGKKLGNADHLIKWEKPKRPKWMTHEEYKTIPDQITVREVEVTISYPGYRDIKVVLATTLLDHNEFTKKDLGQLYRQRWHCELDFRDIKTVLKLDRLKAQSPEMAEKELLSGLLAYNLTRQIICDAAFKNDKVPRDISFKSTRQTMQEFKLIWYSGLSSEEKTNLQLLMLDTIASKTVGRRPGRSEPRAVKARAKKHPYMTKPRRANQKSSTEGLSC